MIAINYNFINLKHIKFMEFKLLKNLLTVM